LIRVTHVFVAAAVLCGGTAAHAQVSASQFYGTLGYAQSELERFDHTLGAVQGRLGWRANRFLAVEAEGAVGSNKDSTTFSMFPPPVMTFTSKIDNQLAAYVVGVAPISERIDLFARAGYGRTELKRTSNVTGQDFSFNIKDDSWNYGVGGEWRLTEKDGVRLDWTRHELDEWGRADQWSVAYQRRF